MASEIKVDTIVNAGGDNDTGIDLATNDQILLKVANATKLTMNATGQTTIVGEGGTTTTSVQQGLAKAWVSASSAAVPYDSFNISNETDHGTGDYSFNLTNSFSDTDGYCQTSTVFTSAHGRISTRNSARDAVGILAVESSNASETLTDNSQNIVAHGDLA